MKNLLLILAIALPSIAIGQDITISSNPTVLTSGDTNTDEVLIDRGQFVGFYELRVMPLLIKVPSGNSGTVQINTFDSSMTNAPAIAAGTSVWITVIDRFWIKFSNGADSIEVYW